MEFFVSPDGKVVAWNTPPTGNGGGQTSKVRARLETLTVEDSETGSVDFPKLLEIARSEGHFESLGRLAGPDDSEVRVEATITPVWKEDKVLLGFFVSLRTVRSGYLQGRPNDPQWRLLRAVIDHLPIHIYGKNAAGEYCLSNAEYVRFLNCNSEKEVLGKTAYDFFPTEIARQYAADDRHVMQTGEAMINQERPFVDLEGQPGLYLTTKAPMTDEQGRICGVVGSSWDISERRRGEEELRESNARLTEAKALAEARAWALERSNTELEAFAHVVSHDLQEPLRVVASYAQLLERQYGECFDSEAKEFIASSVRGAKHMQQLIKDLLAYARVGQEKLRFEPVDLEEVLRSALDNLQPSVEESGAAVTQDSLPVVEADAMMVARLLRNLLDNALKFRAKKPPRIHVGAKLAGPPEADDPAATRYWTISVRDNGIGIDPQFRERIFQPFRRLHTREEYPGSGVGLAVCKKIVEQHGGKIWIDSASANGSVFHFTLPAVREKAP